MTITVKLSDKTMKEMDKFYDDFKRLKTPPYALFQADDADCVVTVYTSGKAVFQGKTADLSSKMWIEMEQHNNPGKKVDVKNSEDKKKDKKKETKIKPITCSAIGSDEVGTGDYFGPIVVTAAYVNKNQIEEINELGVKDSKKLTDEEIVKLVPKFLKKIEYSTYTLSPEKYNEIYDQVSMNMNTIKAILHNKALRQLVDKNLGQEKIIVDQFCDPKLYYRYLKSVPNPVSDITFITKGEDHSVAVACASLISRYIFLQEFDKLSKEIGTTLPKSGGFEADNIGTKLVKEKGFDILTKCAKLNFKNTEKIKEQLKTEM